MCEGKGKGKGYTAISAVCVRTKRDYYNYFDISGICRSAFLSMH
jgi:hypothetical protein